MGFRRKSFLYLSVSQMLSFDLNNILFLKLCTKYKISGPGFDRNPKAYEDHLQTLSFATSHECFHFCAALTRQHVSQIIGDKYKRQNKHFDVCEYIMVTWIQPSSYLCDVSLFCWTVSHFFWDWRLIFHLLVNIFCPDMSVQLVWVNTMLIKFLFPQCQME